MVDNENYEYHPIEGFPSNVRHEMRKGLPPIDVVRVRQKQAALISKLAVSHPKWMLVASNFFIQKRDNNTTSCDLVKFWVYEGRQELGYISMEYYNNDYAYSMDNSRLSATRTRGNSTRTKDMAKAIKIIEKHFYPTTLGERVVRSRDVADSAVNKVAYVNRHNFESHYSRIAPVITAYMMNNLSECQRIVEAHGTLKQVGASLELGELYEAQRAGINLARMYEDGQAVHVLINNGDYVIATKAGSVVIGPDDLTPMAKRNLGMLKLAAIDQFIPDVGLRVTDDLFVVVREKPDEPQATG